MNGECDNCGSYEHVESQCPGTTRDRSANKDRYVRYDTGHFVVRRDIRSGDVSIMHRPGGKRLDIFRDDIPQLLYAIVWTDAAASLRKGEEKKA